VRERERESAVAAPAAGPTACCQGSIDGRGPAVAAGFKFAA
jgi:hypothetical protein